MNQASYILQSQFREITLSVKQAHFFKASTDWQMSELAPTFSHMGFILKGTGTMMVNHQEIHPSKGQLYLLPAKTKQTMFTDAQNPYELYYCHFNIGSCGTELFGSLNLPLCIVVKYPEKAISLCENIIQALEAQTLTSFIQSKQYMLNLISCYLESCPEDSVSFQESLQDSPIAQAIAYAEEHLDQSISVKKMAEVAGYHPSHFAKLFQEKLNISPVQFLIHKKVDYAVEQLTATTRPISEIAEALGFSSQFYFCNFFKKQTGMAPTAYRQIYFRNGSK